MEDDFKAAKLETIKSIATKYFEIKLVQSRAGMYYVAYNTPDMDKPEATESMADLMTALSVFDVILMDLEGH